MSWNVVAKVFITIMYKEHRVSAFAKAISDVNISKLEALNAWKRV
jgi:hypothetical protein